MSLTLEDPGVGSDMSRVQHRGGMTEVGGRHPFERNKEEMPLDQTPGCGGDTAFQTGSTAEKVFPDSGRLSSHIPQVPRACFLFHEFFPRSYLRPTYLEIP